MQTATPSPEAPRARRAIDLVVIHCSASPDGRAVSATDIDRWHRERGFARAESWRARQNPALAAIGYHYVIQLNGAIATGRHIDEVGAHARGVNTRSLGVCVVGTERFAAAQWTALAANVHAVVRWLAERRGVRHGVTAAAPAAALLELAARLGVEIVGHRDLPEVHKACPGFNVRDWLAGGMVALPEHVFSEGER